MKIAIATCKALPEADPDEALLLSALRAAGADARMLAWDGDGGDAEPRAGEIVVLRSTWNYYSDVDRFLAWVDRVARATATFNAAEVIRANVRKTYLGELAAAGVSVVPTAYAMRGEPARALLADVIGERGWGNESIVLKPVVSAGSFLTKRFAATEREAAQSFLEELTRERDAMIQPWMPSVDGYGERALVWIDGELMHAVRKSPRFAGSAESVTVAPIADDERAFAESILAPLVARVGPGLLYARVDIVRDAADRPRLMELELVEPSLFLLQNPAALERLVSAIVARARSAA